MKKPALKTVYIDSLKRTSIIRAGRDESIQAVVFLGSSANGRYSLRADLTGKNSKVEIIGILLAGKGKHIEFVSLQNHKSGGSESDLIFKSVVFKGGKSTYKGKIVISGNAQKSNAYQRNDNLLLHRTSHAQSLPELEIIADDVKCTHGSTTGSLDMEGKYYLKTRGLSDSEADLVMIRGFLESAMVRIKDKKVYHALRKTAEEELEKKVKSEE